MASRHVQCRLDMEPDLAMGFGEEMTSHLKRNQAMLVQRPIKCLQSFKLELIAWVIYFPK